MTPDTSTSSAEAQPTRASRLRPVRRPPFFGMLDSLIVEDGAGPFVSSGAIARADAEAVWIWLHRDVAVELIDPRLPDGEGSIGALDQVMPEVLNRARELVSAAAVS